MHTYELLVKGKVHLFYKQVSTASHGDTVQLTDGNGNIVWNYAYDAFGNQKETVNSGTEPYNPFRYTGEYFDAETGFIYLRARYMNPETGRFISEDPACDGTNWYVYAGGNPVMLFDPSGLAVTDWDRQHCTESDINALNRYTSEWESANAAGNELEMARAHARAEAVRAKYRDSGEYGLSDGNTVYIIYTNDNQSANNQQSELNKLIKMGTDKNGAWSLYDNARFKRNPGFREQLIVVECSQPSFDLENYSVGLGSVSITGYAGGWENKVFDLSLFDVGKLEASAECTPTNIALGALASVWSPSFTIKTSNIDVQISGEVISAGAKIQIYPYFEVGAAGMFGASVKVIPHN